MPFRLQQTWGAGPRPVWRVHGQWPCVRAVALLLFALLPAMAQSAAAISGTLRSAGLPIPGATITAIQGAHKLVTTTDEAGRYEFDNVAPGTWTIQAEMLAFGTVHRDVTISAAPLTADLNMIVSAALQQPAQFASRPGTTNAAGNRAAGGFRNLNLTQAQGLDAESLAATQSTPAATTNTADANEAFLMNGTVDRGLQQSQQMDLMFQNRQGWDQGQSPSLFGQTQQGPAMGGFGGGPGGFGGGRGGFGGGPAGRGGFAGRNGRPPFPGQGAFGNRARRGRQGMHGSLFASLDNSALDARQYSLTGETVPKSAYAFSRFGAVVGGPLSIPKLFHSDKTFFFFSYFGTRGRTPEDFTATVPTAAERLGDFSEARNANGTSAQIFNPLTHQPFAGNIIPSTMIDPAAAGLLSFIPLPNQSGLIQNYQYVTSIPNNGDNFGLRLNHNFSRRDRVDANINGQRRSGDTAQLFGYTDSTDGYGFSGNVGWTHNISAAALNTARVNFSRNVNETVPFFAYGVDVAAELGIGGVSGEPINYGPPNLSFTNFGALTDASPMRIANQTTGGADAFTLIRGEHTLTFGADYRRMQLNSRTDQNARGTYSFSGLLTSAFDAGGQPVAGTGFDMADFLLGLPQSSSIRFGDTSTYFRAWATDGYVMDDWKITPSLTLNVGLRYEYFQPYSEKYGHIANLAIAPDFTGVTVITPGAAGASSALIDGDPHMFSPRVAIAWRPFKDKEAIVRSGYGIYYNGSIYAQFPSQLAAQPPFASSGSLVTSLTAPLTIQDGFAIAPSKQVTNTYAVAQDYRPGYAQTWNFTVQDSLTQSLVLELGYLGTKGTDLDVQTMPNSALPGSPLTAEQRRTIGNATGFIYDNSVGNSTYNALQARLIRRFTHGMSLNAQYTLSKSIDDASTIGGGAVVVAQNFMDLAAERGLSSFDRRHVLNLQYVLESPVGGPRATLHTSRWAEVLLSNWMVSGGITMESGLPFTARILGNQSDIAGTGSVGSGRAEATGQPIDAGSGLFNTGAFTLPPAGLFGDAGRNTITGPYLFSANLSLARHFELGERRRLEFRVDAKNFSNSVSYTGIGTVVNATNYGLPTSAASMRTLTGTIRFRF
jgi:hypothetical protein